MEVRHAFSIFVSPSWGKSWESRQFGSVLIPFRFLGITLLFCFLISVSEAVQFKPAATFGFGYQNESLNWNVTGTQNNPEVLSELRWENLHLYKMKAGLRIFADDVYFRGKGEYGWFFSGENQNTDYASTNRSSLISQSQSDTSGNHIFDFSVAAGYRFGPESKKYNFIPLVGYSGHVQKLGLSNGLQTVTPTAVTPSQFTANALPNGTAFGLDSVYRNRWSGPWLGLDLQAQANPNLMLTASAEYHWFDFYGEGDWNLRSELAHTKSFEQVTRGTGRFVSLGAEYSFSPLWFVSGSLDFRDWTTKSGTHAFFFTNGTSSESKLNEVRRDSLSFDIVVGYRFAP